MKRCVSCLLPETHETISFNSDGVCNICQNQGIKQSIDWAKRLNDLDELISKYKGKHRYDCIIPFSGGKDSTWTLFFLKNRYPDLRPLVVRFNHGFLRPTVQKNCLKAFRKLGVDVHEFTPNWNVVKKLMLQAFLEKGDFCWHCHTGIYAYPMQVAVTQQIPLLFWGETSGEYSAYYSYEEKFDVNEEHFNRVVNLGISSDDMLVRLDGLLDERDLEPFRYPEISSLQELNYHSAALGDYVPWDVKRQVSIIKDQLGWEGDLVENVPPEYNYEKIECWMQGVRDYIKYIKRGYSRPSHLSAIDLRTKRITIDDAKKQIKAFEGKRPPSLDLFLEYIGIDEEQFYNIAVEHIISPWNFDPKSITAGDKTGDFDTWLRGDGLSPTEAEDQISCFANNCSSCGFQ